MSCDALKLKPACKITVEKLFWINDPHGYTK